MKTVEQIREEIYSSLDKYIGLEITPERVNNMTAEILEVLKED